MQDKTINNALHALRKAGGQQGKLAEVLLDMRGQPLTFVRHEQRLKRGQSKQIILQMLATGPKTTTELGQALMDTDTAIGRQSATNRAYQALLRMMDKGLVRCDGRVWASKANTP